VAHVGVVKDDDRRYGFDDRQSATVKGIVVAHGYHGRMERIAQAGSIKRARRV
jgi:hypothetical protein